MQTLLERKLPICPPLSGEHRKRPADATTALVTGALKPGDPSPAVTPATTGFTVTDANSAAAPPRRRERRCRARLTGRRRGNQNDADGLFE
jgi:hypothetical protein